MNSKSFMIVVLIVSGLFAVQTLWSRSAVDSQARRVEALKSEVESLSLTTSQLEELRSQVEQQAKTLKAQGDELAYLRTRVPGHHTSQTLDDTEVAATLETLDSDPQLLEAVSHRVRQDLQNDPGFVKPVDPLEIEAVVSKVQEKSQIERQQRRRERHEEQVRRQAATYTEKLGLVGAQATQLETLLIENMRINMTTWEKVRDGELDWDEARQQRGQREAENDVAVEALIGPEKMETYRTLRDEERERDRRGF